MRVTAHTSAVEEGKHNCEVCVLRGGLGPCGLQAGCSLPVYRKCWHLIQVFKNKAIDKNSRIWIWCPLLQALRAQPSPVCRAPHPVQAHAAPCPWSVTQTELLWFLACSSELHLLADSVPLCVCFSSLTFPAPLRQWHLCDLGTLHVGIVFPLLRYVEKCPLRLRNVGL